jgi:hypothetical protein
VVLTGRREHKDFRETTHQDPQGLKELKELLEPQDLQIVDLKQTSVNSRILLVKFKK